MLFRWTYRGSVVKSPCNNQICFVTTATKQIKPKQCKEVLKISKILKILLFTKVFFVHDADFYKNRTLFIDDGTLNKQFGFNIFRLVILNLWFVFSALNWLKKMWCENLIWFKFINLYHISVSPFPSNFSLFFDFFCGFFLFLDLFLGFFFLFHFLYNCFNINNNNWREKYELNGFLQRMETRTILFSS